MASWIKAKKEDKDQLAMGIKIEAEHAPTIEKIRASVKDGQIGLSDEEIYALIAADHISESETYYTDLAKIEKKSKGDQKKEDPKEENLEEAMTEEEKETLK